jgi:ribosome recycling factor
MQRVNNRAMSDDVNDNFNATQNEQIQKLIKQFVKDIDAVINS